MRSASFGLRLRLQALGFTGVEDHRGSQQVSFPNASSARQIHPSASRRARYCWRIESRCWSQGWCFCSAQAGPAVESHSRRAKRSRQDSSQHGAGLPRQHSGDLGSDLALQQLSEQSLSGVWTIPSSAGTGSCLSQHPRLQAGGEGRQQSSADSLVEASSCSSSATPEGDSWMSGVASPSQQKSVQTGGRSVGASSESFVGPRSTVLPPQQLSWQASLEVDSASSQPTSSSAAWLPGRIWTMSQSVT